MQKSTEILPNMQECQTTHFKIRPLNLAPRLVPATSNGRIMQHIPRWGSRGPNSQTSKTQGIHTTQHESKSLTRGV
uniref:Uncharacterized protein n=1 Tax=Arundo donax TaxID=35708 RepID=A0A0A9HL56_ARUDO